jgi:hypothetical protein
VKLCQKNSFSAAPLIVDTPLQSSLSLPSSPSLEASSPFVSPRLSPFISASEDFAEQHNSRIFLSKLRGHPDYLLYRLTYSSVMSWQAACSSSNARPLQAVSNEADACGWIAVSFDQICARNFMIFDSSALHLTQPSVALSPTRLNPHASADCRFCRLRCCERRLVCDVVET